LDLFGDDESLRHEIRDLIRLGDVRHAHAITARMWTSTSSTSCSFASPRGRKRLSVGWNSLT
jgi:hypothetical protein